MAFYWEVQAVRRFALLLALLAVVLFAGCLAVDTPAKGLIFTNVRGPITTTGGVGEKVGKASATAWFGLVAVGDCSIEAAAKQAGITKIQTIDHHSQSVLGIWGRYTTVVRGE